MADKRKSIVVNSLSYCMICGRPRPHKHMTDRKVRLAIQKERETHVILSTDDGNGYFRPTEKDYEYVRMYHVRERARARTILDNLNPVMDFLRTYEGAVRSG